jgi:hypothetical protein
MTALEAPTTVPLPVVAKLGDLPGDGAWAYWLEPIGDDQYTHRLARRLDDNRYVAVLPLLFTWGVVVGRVVDETGYDDRWCYSSLEAAVAYATVWDGDGEPEGWHRHPPTGRRRPDGDPTKEYVNP